MKVRDEMLIELVKEVLGPREGIYEILPEENDPRSEYITGVLEPEKVSSFEERIEDNVDEVIEETSSEEDQSNQGFVASPGIFSPALDPRALPRSIGLSFTLEAENGDPQIEICATWAKYEKTISGWNRQPAYFLTGIVNTSQDNQQWDVANGIQITLRTHALPGGGKRISVFIVNRTEVAENKKPDTQDYVFQPQLRVHLCAGTHIVPVQISGSEANLIGLVDEAQEEQSVALQYRHRTALARGHMCGAIWQEIDPERPANCVIDGPAETPFAWIDASLVPETERIKFAPADLRSELVPVYLIEAPEMGWPGQYLPAPVLDPAVLAETWLPEAVRNAIQPLVNGYKAWIDEQEQKIPLLDHSFQEIAHRNIEKCRWAVDRMTEAINVLCQDESVRLAFCFANKAIATQALWKNKAHPLIWRPFQLAFILLNIPPLANPLHPDRDVCDLLWFPTGGGKTEAYLGLTAFVLALRRLKTRENQSGDKTGAGVSVISRYTLRLLSIQQFRRALGVITACELLRVLGLKDGKPAGWRPAQYPYQDKFLWGGLRFSAGLWVGGDVTPNALQGFGPIPASQNTYFAGALDILRGLSKSYDGPDPALRRLTQYPISIKGEPAQVTQCPACGTVLAIPSEGLGKGDHTLHFLYTGGKAATSLDGSINPPDGITIRDIRIRPRETSCVCSVYLTIAGHALLKSDMVDKWWEGTLKPGLSAPGKEAQLQSARASRPGYFILHYENLQRNQIPADFEIFCPNPDCELNQHAWAEQVPLSLKYQGKSSKAVRQMALGFNSVADSDLPEIIYSGLEWQSPLDCFSSPDLGKKSYAIPIPACTVDDQVYHRVPSLIIATADKFARLAFEADAAALFGNVTHYHSRFGYYRIGSPPGVLSQSSKTYDPHPKGFDGKNTLHCEVEPFCPPDLILQDELHLIEGPLGSMVGLYETAVDYLCQCEKQGIKFGPKYIASTATVRRAESQVQALFQRRLMQFPPPAISADERFFATHQETHPLNTNRAGRLYVTSDVNYNKEAGRISKVWTLMPKSTSNR